MSPSIVSGRVVATVSVFVAARDRIADVPQMALDCLREWFRRSEMAVWQRGHQLTMYSPR